MKNKFLIMAFMLLMPTLASAQFEMVKVSEAFHYINSQKEETGNKNLILVQGMEYIESEGIFLDFFTGTSTAWTFMYNSKDTSDHKAYIYTIVKSAGEFGGDYNTDDSFNYQLMNIIDTNFVDSDSICANVVMNESFMDFYSNNIDSIFAKIMQINYNQKYGSNVWSVAAFASSGNNAQCFYSVTSGDLYDCNFITTSIKNSVQKLLNAYPNPASDIIRIEAPFTGLTQIQIYNNYGKIVKSDNIRFENSAEINLSYLSAGVYTIKLLNGKEMVTKKISITR